MENLIQSLVVVKDINDIIIFILDDNRDTLKIIDYDFKEKGISNYHLFHDYKELIEKAKELKPDLIFLDFNLDSRLTGYDVMIEVKKYVKARFVFMSCLITVDELAVINNEGCGHFLNKSKNFLPELYKALHLERDRIIKNRVAQIDQHNKEDTLQATLTNILNTLQ